MKPYEYGFHVFLSTFCYVMVSGYNTGKWVQPPGPAPPAPLVVVCMQRVVASNGAAQGTRSMNNTVCCCYLESTCCCQEEGDVRYYNGRTSASMCYFPAGEVEMQSTGHLSREIPVVAKLMVLCLFSRRIRQRKEEKGGVVCFVKVAASTLDGSILHSTLDGSIADLFSVV